MEKFFISSIIKNTAYSASYKRESNIKSYLHNKIWLDFSNSLIINDYE